MKLVARFVDPANADACVAQLAEAGVPAFARQSQDLGGMLGTAGVDYLVEVADEHEARARELVASEAAPAPLEAPEVPEPDEELPGNLGLWRLASRLSLGAGLAVFALSVMARERNLFVLGAVVFDYLIWRRLTEPALTADVARRVRGFGLMRSLVGLGVLALAAFAKPEKTSLAWLSASVVVTALYLLSAEQPKPAS